MRGQDTAQFQTWLAHHTGCHRNYHGPSGSGGMKVTAAKMWDRSLDRRFRYTTMVLDGDSRTFKRLTEMKIYGDDMKITKEECINHVNKRMGTALRKLQHKLRRQE